MLQLFLPLTFYIPLPVAENLNHHHVTIMMICFDMTNMNQLYFYWHAYCLFKQIFKSSMIQAETNLFYIDSIPPCHDNFRNHSPQHNEYHPQLSFQYELVHECYVGTQLLQAHF